MAKKAFLETGRIVTTHGIHGEVKVEPWCDTPAMLAALERVYLDEQGQQELKVEQGAVYKRMVLLKLAGFDTIEQAQTLRGQVLFLNREDLDLPDGSYFVQDLLGCRVVDADRPALSYGRLVQVCLLYTSDRKVSQSNPLPFFILFFGRHAHVPIDVVHVISSLCVFSYISMNRN